MKILQIGPLPPEVGGLTTGGVGSHMWDLSRHLVRRRHNVAVLADNLPRKYGFCRELEGVQIFNSNCESFGAFTGALNPRLWSRFLQARKEFGRLYSPATLLKNIVQYHSAIAAFDPQLIHIHHLQHRFPFAYFAAPRPIPTVTTIHSFNALEFTTEKEAEHKRALVQKNLAKATHLFFVSRYIQEQAELLFPNEMGATSLQSTTVYNPVDSKSFRPVSRQDARQRLGLQPDEQVVVFVGNLLDRKGADTLIEAVARLQAEGSVLRTLIVGDGPEQSRLRTLIDARGVGERVSLEGNRSASELPFYYSAADVFVLPSKMESFGLVFIEAMLCGCPVVGTPEVLRELLPSDSIGLYVGPDSTAANDVGQESNFARGYQWQSDEPQRIDRLTEALKQALAQTWDREAIRTYAIGFGWEQNLESFESHYARVVAGKPLVEPLPLTRQRSTQESTSK